MSIVSNYRDVHMKSQTNNQILVLNKRPSVMLGTENLLEYSNDTDVARLFAVVTFLKQECSRQFLL